MKHETIKLDNETLILLDQRKLPGKIEFFEANDYQEVAFAISDMVVRGAPAIGATGAYGVFLAALEYDDLSENEFVNQMKEAIEYLNKARPTAVNLSWATKRMFNIIKKNSRQDRKALIRLLEQEANNIAREDVEINKTMAKHGNKIVPISANILTHCNTGALATVDYGTALGVIREAHRNNKNIHVYADETRPRLQGARLTGFELVEENIPATLIADSVAATLMRDGKIDLVLVGADRVAANGDVANKIGTYMLSELARVHSVPFYVVAPRSTVDYNLDHGNLIEIEERSSDEVKKIGSEVIAPEGIRVYNPAFDITPAENINGIITEYGIVKPPFVSGLRDIKDKRRS
ncbi:MAG: S-methyl-5-thioribose-1-phosphate isomerase [Bacillota bacterium]